MSTWSENEVLQLINLWGEEGVQEQLEGSKRNKHVYIKISKALEKININKDCDQCRTKIKKLKLDYRKAKDKNGKTGRGRAIWKYFEALDAILGNRPATKPPTVIDTGATKATEDEEEDSDELDEESMTSSSDLASKSSSSTEEEQDQQRKVSTPKDASNPAKDVSTPKIVSTPKNVSTGIQRM